MQQQWDFVERNEYQPMIVHFYYRILSPIDSIQIRIQ